MPCATGRQLLELSTELARWKLVTSLGGVVGGALNAMMSAYKAQDAGGKGEESARTGYLWASAAFGVTAVTSSYAAADAASSQAVSRLIARRILLRTAGAVAAETLAAPAAGVAAFVSGVGLVLLIVGIAATVYAGVMTRDELQRWAARSYFGRHDTGKDASPFASQQEEDEGLDKALAPPATPEPFKPPPLPGGKPDDFYGID